LTEPQQDAAAKRRARQTLINLLLALGATVAMALTLVMVVPRDDSNLIKPVDFAAIATDVRQSVGIDVLAPDTIPTGWWSNSARWRDNTADGVNYWHVGFVGPKSQYIGVDQVFATNPTWLAQRTAGFEVASAPKQSGNFVITEYVGTADGKNGEKLWLYTHGDNQDAIIIDGTASVEDFQVFFDLLKLPN
jgi:hypothetical protein